MEENAKHNEALSGNIVAFQELFITFQSQLKSYLYRLTASRNDADDLTHDTFIKAFDKLHTFKGEASLKTWVFQIATNLAYNHLKKCNRWEVDVKTQAKKITLENKSVSDAIVTTHQNATDGRYDITEHIDTCFTCMSKTLPIENQVALMLKDVYDFSIADIQLILEKTEGVSKYLVQDARKTMRTIFDNRCALINKDGVCNQCSELNGWLNPRQNQQEELMKLDLVKESKKYNREELYELRPQLVKAIDPLKNPGADLQELFLKCNRMAMGEVAIE